MAIPKTDIRDNDQNIFSVSELTQEIKLLLETGFATVWVEGEVSNYKLHSSGHMYFVLKDENAQINCTMWRSRNQMLYFSLQDGMKVQAQGRVTVYEKRGSYQLDVVQIRPAGIGNLQMAFELLKKKLREEGLFEASRKKPLPPYPERIGIVTSATGAAIQDLMAILRRRFPSLELILRPTLVQGEGAAEDIASAIDEFNAYGEVDVLIIGRGGGSLEDLWAFNEEIVARAIARSRIPIVSAVGHEVDFSISDFVADLRAPTPSAAAELVVKNKADLLQFIRLKTDKMSRLLTDRIASYQEKLRYIRSGYGFRRPADITRQFQQRLDELQHTLEMAQQHRLDLARKHLELLTQRLQALGPESILNRGYSICFTASDGQLLRDASRLHPGQKIWIQLGQGALDATADEIRPQNNLDDTMGKWKK